MVEVGMPCIFEMGMVGMLGAPMVGNVGAPMVGFWGAMGNLGNLARAASISSLLIIAFVAALTCLGAIWIFIFCNTQSLCLSSRFWLQQLVFAGFSTNWERVRGGCEMSQRITQIRNTTNFPATLLH